MFNLKNLKKMKHLKSIRLNKIKGSNLNQKELKKIIGGACTNYTCQCNGSGMASSTSFVDSHIDGQSSAGYL